MKMRLLVVKDHARCLQFPPNFPSTLNYKLKPSINLHCFGSHLLQNVLKADSNAKYNLADCPPAHEKKFHIWKNIKGRHYKWLKLMLYLKNGVKQISVVI